MEMEIAPSTVVALSPHPSIHSEMKSIIWLAVTLAYVSAIVSPTFDLNVVQVEDGEYYIQSVESGSKYLSMTGVVGQFLSLVGFQMACLVTMDIALGVVD